MQSTHIMENILTKLYLRQNIYLVRYIDKKIQI